MSWSASQISVGQQVIGVVKSLGLSPADEKEAELIAIEAAEAESDLANLGYGDYPSSMGGQMSSSRGVFQQIAAWGPLEDRTNVSKATEMFLKGGQGGQRGLLGVPGWNTQPSYQAAQAVQGSEFSDGSNYRDRMADAQAFLAAYAGGAAPVAPGSANPAGGAPPAAGGTPTAGAQPAGYTAQPASIWTDIFMGPIPGLVGGALDASGKVVGNSLVTGIVGFALESVFVVGGLGLVVLGVWRASGPARGKIAAAAQSVPIPV